MTDERYDVVVVGGGLAGLAAAVTAARAGRRTLVLDAHGFGGRARTDTRDGFVFNRGPRALYLGGHGRRVLEDLDVDVSRGGSAPTRGSMAQRDGGLHLLPVGPGSLARTPLLGARDKAQAAALLARLPRLDPAEQVGRTVDEWLAATGVRPRVAELLRALVRLSTYVHAPDVLDAGAALQNLQLATSDGVRYLDGGFQSLADALVAVAWDSRVELRDHVGVRSVTPGPEPTVHTTDGHTIRADSVVLAVGTPTAAAGLLDAPVPAWDDLTPPATAACLELGVRRVPRHRFVLGVDEPLYLSTHCPPADLAPDGMAVVHVMRYQPVDDAMSAADQHDQLRTLAAHAGITPDDVVEERFLARMVVTGTLPAAASGGLAGRPGAQVPGHEGVLVAGDWVGPVGQLSDAALASGREAGRVAASRSDRMRVP